MMRAVKIRRFAVGLAAAWTILSATSCSALDSPMIVACEIALKKTLLSPSTFHRINIVETQETLTFEQYEAANPGDSPNVRAALRQAAKQPPSRLTIFFEYDAANAYGTQIRSASKCSYDDRKGDGSSASEHSVRIDGMTTTERLIEQVKRLHSKPTR
jgi:hypothetical protein